MTQQMGSASASEAAAPPPPHTGPVAAGNGPSRNAAQAAGPRNAASWARKVERLGIQHPVVVTKTTCVDARRQWRHASNIWHNSMIRSVRQTIAAPLVGLGRILHRDKRAA